MKRLPVFARAAAPLTAQASTNTPCSGAEQAFIHGGPQPRCVKRSISLARDDVLTARYRIEGWLYATHVNHNRTNLDGWFRESGLAPIGGHGDIQTHRAASSSFSSSGESR